ncbi:MAG: hypothetical protein PHG21_14365, partial [Azoarcus sp.]|nr:hypothetical protein [Azoarcus sp.]
MISPKRSGAALARLSIRAMRALDGDNVRKNLKAIAVRGTKGVGNIRDPKAFMAATKAAKKVLARSEEH